MVEIRLYIGFNLLLLLAKLVEKLFFFPCGSIIKIVVIITIFLFFIFFIFVALKSKKVTKNPNLSDFSLFLYNLTPCETNDNTDIGCINFDSEWIDGNNSCLNGEIIDVVSDCTDGVFDGDCF